MNSRERFLETMRYGNPDRVPYFEEGIRDEVLEAWRRQPVPPNLRPKGRSTKPLGSGSMTPDAILSRLFYTDQREEIQLDLDPRPDVHKWPSSRSELDVWQQKLDPYDSSRLPENWPERVCDWQERDHVLMLRVHRGFFLTMGVNDWRRFLEIVYLVKDDPEFVREAMVTQGLFAAELAQRVLGQVEVDAVVFSLYGFFHKDNKKRVLTVILLARYSCPRF